MARTTLISLLDSLVSFRTVTGDHEAATKCLDFVSKFLEDRGMHIERYVTRGYPSLVATTRPTKKPLIMLQAHLDVVPAKNELFKLKIQNNKFIGRGVFDMKFAAACYMQLVDELQESLSAYDFGIMLTTDEEIGGKTNSVADLIEAGYGADVCVIPDGGDNWFIEKSAKGAWFAYVKMHGQSAHGSRPWEGQNPILRLNRLIGEIQQLFTNQSAESDTLSVTSYHGGKAMNQIPDYAETGLDIRFNSRESFEMLQSKMIALVDKHGAEIESKVLVDAVTHDISLPIIQCWLQLAEHLTGNQLSDTRSFGASDARFFVARGIPCIVMRPRGGNAHGNAEWLNKKDLQIYYHLLRNYVEIVANGEYLDKQRLVRYTRSVTKDSAQSV